MGTDKFQITLLALALFATSCAAAVADSNDPAVRPTTSVTNVPDTSEIENDDQSSAKINRRVEMEEDIFNPSLLPYDAIKPIYEPEFVSAADSPLKEEELVIGISLNGESKAYPITPLRSREMVNDELGGLPILVTW